MKNFRKQRGKYMKKKRKTDRRTLYTRSVIKDSLLEALGEKNFDQITVTDVCRRAEITRATYYLHYQSLTEVLDELLLDALQCEENKTINPNADLEQIAALLTLDGTNSLKQNESLLPVCHRVAQLPKYQVIFHDESISSYVINQIYQWQQPKLVPSFMKKLGISKKEAEMLVLFIIHGTYAVNKALHWKKDDIWYQIHSMLLKYTAGGYGRLIPQKKDKIEP